MYPCGCVRSRRDANASGLFPNLFPGLGGEVSENSPGKQRLSATTGPDSQGVANENSFEGIYSKRRLQGAGRAGKGAGGGRSREREKGAGEESEGEPERAGAKSESRGEEREGEERERHTHAETHGHWNSIRKK